MRKRQGALKEQQNYYWLGNI